MLRKSLADYYALLGLQPGASPEKIKQAYRTLVRQWHPDKFTHDRRLQQTAEATLKDINEAYAVLRDLRPHNPSYTQPPSTGQTARTSTAGNSGAGRTYTTAGTNRSGYQSTTAQKEPSTNWHSAPVPPNRGTSQIPRWAPMVFLYGLLALTNLFTSSSTHSAPAALPVTPPSTPQFTNIMPHITTTQRAWDEYYRQNPPAGRKEARIKPPAVSLRGIDKLQREIFGSAAKPMVFKPVIRPGNIDWPGLKIANDTPFRKQDIPIMPPPVWITPSDPK